MLGNERPKISLRGLVMCDTVILPVVTEMAGSSLTAGGLRESRSYLWPSVRGRAVQAWAAAAASLHPFLAVTHSRCRPKYRPLAAPHHHQQSSPLGLTSLLPPSIRTPPTPRNAFLEAAATTSSGSGGGGGGWPVF